MFAKFKNWLNGFHLSLRMKIILALSAIVVVLVLSSIISILELRRMSNYVSDMIAEDINSIRTSRRENIFFMIIAHYDIIIIRLITY